MVLSPIMLLFAFSKRRKHLDWNRNMVSKLLQPNKHKTQCQDEVRILSGRTQKLKVAKQCWKQLNEHNLMYIYYIQCENMQKIQ